ncbi:hypothetical protein L1887_17900 [Cichorium endivia]|nr:hypothetical protein L1887_17900 [Cichorium endivia]
MSLASKKESKTHRKRNSNLRLTKNAKFTYRSLSNPRLSLLPTSSHLCHHSLLYSKSNPNLPSVVPRNFTKISKDQFER